MVHKKLLASHYHIFIPMLFIVFLLLGVFITIDQTRQIQKLESNAATGNCTVTASKLIEKSQEQTLLGEINTYRIQHNVDHLIWDNTLKQSAEWQSLDMLAHNTLSHTDSLGRTADIRLADCGYNIDYGYGENIANGTADPTSVFNAWKNDPPHNQILLNSRYNITGIALETDSSGKAFWTMDFGASAIPVTPLPLSTTPATVSPTTVIPTGSSITLTPSTSTNPTISSSPTTSSAPSISPSIALPSPTLGPATADMQINVQVHINGLGQDGNPNPKHLTRRVAAIVYGVTNQQVANGTAFLTYDGSNYFTGVIHLGKMTQGPYFIKLVSDFTLQVLAKPEFQNLMINQVNNIPPVTLYQGDMNGDNILDINDYNLVLPCFQSIPTCANVNTIDFNDDGVTDVKDYNLFLNSFEILHGN